MEKHQQDSISSVGVGKEYPPSEAFSDHPPPAYHHQQRQRAPAVQIARIAAATVIAVTFILGFFMLASAYITASASCSGFALQEALRQELEDQPQYQHLTADDPLQSDESADALKRESADQPQHQQQQQQQPSAEAPIQLRLPLTLDLDDIAGSLVEKNQRSRMNCVVEKRRAEEVMDHQPKTVRLPFGVNLTTDPRYEHVTGERMAIFCESGNDQRQVPVDNSIASGPVVLPLPEGMHLIPMPVPMGPHGPMLPPPPPPHMMSHHQPHAFPYPHPSQQFPHHAPPPPQVQPQQALPLPLNDIPMSILQRIAQDAEAADSKDDSPVHIFAREEVFPIFHPAAPEGRAMHSAPAPVPADMVQPPPPPHPEARQTTLLRPAPDHSRPHFVQPRSVRSVDDTFLKRDKRVKRCACDCAC